MTDDQQTNTALSVIFQADQDIEATAGRIGQFYERLRASGMTEEAAAEITATYSAMLIGEHFGIDVANTYGVASTYEED